MRANPLVVETLHGMLRPGRAHLDYALYLFLLAAAVFIWWPKHTLIEALQQQHPPDTLLAALLLCGVILAYYSVRAGAEEFLLDGQHGLRDWTVGTDLSLPHILFGYVGAHLLHSMHLIALSSPIILLAFQLSGGQWPALLACLAMIVWQSLFYRLAAAAIYISMGHYGALTAICTRALIVAVYLLSALALPATSQLILTANVLDGGSLPNLGHAHSALMHFAALYGALSASVLLVLYRQLLHLRMQRSTEVAAQ